MTAPLFLIPIAVGLLTQALKPLLNQHFYAELDSEGRKVPRYGGMPSAHTAFAVSLVTVVGWVDGVSTTSFALAAALLILILDDALRMRMFLGHYGRALYQLIAKLPAQERAAFPYLERRLGHKPVEVIVGAVVGGIFSSVLLFFLA